MDWNMIEGLGAELLTNGDVFGPTPVRNFSGGLNKWTALNAVF